MRVQVNGLTPELFLELYQSVGWEAPGKEQVEEALRHTLATFTAYDGERPVGMVRLLGDGGMSFYVKDFAVLPSYQSRGVGSLLLDSVQQYIRGAIRPGWAVSLELISSKGAVAFYKRKGFEERPSEDDGPGMMKMLRT